MVAALSYLRLGTDPSSMEEELSSSRYLLTSLSSQASNALPLAGTAILRVIACKSILSCTLGSGKHGPYIRTEEPELPGLGS